jgi:hypothetical protein
MADQQPLKATFFAFQRREQGGALTQTALGFVILAAALIAGFVALFWQSIGPFFTWYAQILSAATNNDTAAIEAMGFPPQLGMFLLGLMLWLFPFYILCAAFEAGCLRWMIHGERGGFMGLTLGAPTWRVWSVYWMWFLLNIAFSIVMGILTGVLVGVLAVSTGGDPGAVVSAQLVVTLVQYVLMAYFAIRFAPAAATTIARRKFSFFDAWTVTKGRFWALFGSFLLLYIVYAVFSLILAGGMIAYLVGVAGIDLASVAADPSNANAAARQFLEAFATALSQPTSWAIFGGLYLIGSFVGIVFYIATFGVNARAALVALEEGKIKPAA